MKRKTLHAVVRFLFWLLSELEVIGRENIPPAGGCLLASNHISRIDAALVFMVSDRPDTTALVADKYQQNIFFGWLVNIVHGIWINRDEADFRALREARDYLQSDGALGIAPEGTRSRDATLLQGKTGVAFLVEKSGVPVIPVAIWGTEDAVARLFRLRRPHIHIRFGAALHLPAVSRQDREGSLRRNTDEIMCHIAAMLPPAYRGVYAGHPRLKELLEQGLQTAEATVEA